VSFTSWSFLPFIAIVLPLYHALPFRWQNRMLMCASCVFYAAWDPRFLGLLLFSIGTDYLLGRQIARQDDPVRRKAMLLLSCTLNLGLLGFFKYFGFFVENASALLAWFGLNIPSFELKIILPIGISFYTFHSLSYIIDIYRRARVPLHRFSDYALYVLYFPQLVAGPIARAHDLIPQLERPRVIRYHHWVQGGWLIVWGYYKKLVVADNLAPLVNEIFGSRYSATGVHCLLAIYAFAFQIYGDFSGYTDIARGLGKLMGIELMLNFQVPYIARNPADFWSRWHISLSTWLRDYLYIPLGGNRRGELITYRNLMLTMLLGGLWHGAAWNFVGWGAYHGLLLSVHRWLWKRRGASAARPHGRTSAVVSIVVMFHLTCFGWLLFRVSNLSQAGHFLTQITTNFAFDAKAVEMLGVICVLGASMFGIELWLKNTDDPRTRPGWNFGLGPLTVALLLLAILLLTPVGGNNFLYFQF
jgi:alginate O-acetyltransferase complex protein AlgI